MEHLNRRLKSVICGMGANVKPSSIKRAGNAIDSVYHVCQVFEQQTSSHLHSDKLTIPEFGKDFDTILQVLEEEKVFATTQLGNTSLMTLIVV